MEQYQFKGYRMLGSTCEVCGVSIIVKIAYWTFLALSVREVFTIYLFLFVMFLAGFKARSRNLASWVFWLLNQAHHSHIFPFLLLLLFLDKNY